MALDFWMYQDPMKVLMSKQGREAKQKRWSCDGCKHVEALTMGHVVYRKCDIGRRYGRKCERYEQKGAA